jgi:hypothetical protein
MVEEEAVCPFIGMEGGRRTRVTEHARYRDAEVALRWPLGFKGARRPWLATRMRACSAWRSTGHGSTRRHDGQAGGAGKEGVHCTSARWQRRGRQLSKGVGPG